MEVGFYDQQTDNMTWKENSSGGELVRWPGGKAPQDRTIILSDVKTVALTLYVPMVAISVLGIILALVLMVINNKFDYRRIIQHSHPSCNNLILAGNILCLLATIPLGINSKWVRTRTPSLVWYARPPPGGRPPPVPLSLRRS